MSKEIKRIAVFTSGGDAPGMNAALRAVVRNASFHDLHVYGVFRGYEGMIDGDLERLERGDVGNIIHRGGTILKTARSERFRTEEGRKAAYESLLAFDIDACIAIGGNGTFTGADLFAEEFNMPFIGIPGTIDNDLFGTDYTIGFDTAINTAIEAVDKIRDTADSHNRLFFVEVMGRHSGYIALNTGIGSGAGSVIIPEVDTPVEALVEALKKSARRKKLFSVIIVAEGNQTGSAQDIARMVKEQFDFYDTKVAIIGHLQRGGSPTAMDRVLASRLGFHAVEGLLEGRENVMAGLVNNKIKFTPLKEAIVKPKKPDKELIRMAEILAL
ncbi:MAG: 6-phosphofructokinase [Lewinellaceae bacterium]|nr:6-phosphofructokinase [Phaeodactylibacter sp.]MCB0612213.1 6-phosphofructokinase [Phaeodactylibacter sp.]MCB9349353.1 6-phosphofructokinase [Lewinellaceae bacterium]